MSLLDTLKKSAGITAAVATIATTQIGVGQTKTNNSTQGKKAVIQESTEYLDNLVQKGVLINGETQQQRSDKWKIMKEEKGVVATLESIEKEKIKEIQLSKKDEAGYYIQKIDFENGRTSVETYYPNGVLKSKDGEHGEEAESFYPDGSRKLSRTADGVETKYYPGGEKGKERIQETPHGIYDAFDVLDEQGRRMEHHHDVELSTRNDGKTVTSLRDVKTVDIYNPATQELEASYTLDEWNINEGRVAKIGYVDENGKMKTLEFRKPKENGDRVLYTDSLDTDMIKEIYREEMQERQQKVLKTVKGIGVSR